MKKIKNVFSKLDFFGVDFSFKYKNNDKYRTSLGGLFFILFCVAVLVIVIYYFIPFIDRKNYSIIYYSMNLAKTEKVILNESKASFAIGLTCNVDQEYGIKGEDLLNFESRFIILKKESDGQRKKTKEILSSHPCTYSDFYNNYNDQVDLLGLNHLQCLDKTDYAIEGLYTDEVFAYYEFSVISKEDNPEHFEKIYNYLTRNDCYLELYYMDISFDLNNYKEPVKPYMNSLYIQLNPITLIKKNIYFMNQYFDDDDYLVFVYDRQEPMKQILFSKTEEITFYKGKDRGIKKPGDYDCYAKFYIRADIKKTEIKRKYQKIAEFYADASSLLLTIFNVLLIIFGFLNKFWGEQILCDKLFFFQDLNLNICNKEDKIKHLIYATDLNKNINLKTSLNTTIDEKNENINNTIKNFKNDKIKISNIQGGRYSSKNLNNALDKLPKIEQKIRDLDYNNFNNNEKICYSFQEKENKIGRAHV